MTDRVTRKQLADLAGISTCSLAAWAKGKYTKLPKPVHRVGNTYYYGRGEAEQWVANFHTLQAQKADGTRSAPLTASHLPMRFQLTLDQKIDWDLKMLRARHSKPKTQTVKLIERYR